jgi:predicted secreted Zn-dependent protease
MKFRFTLLTLTCCVALCACSIATASAQYYHQLTMDDFQGIPSYKMQGEIAYINSTIDFRYEAHREPGYYRLNFNIRLKLNNDKSWMDKRRITSEEMLAEILKHEQGHYLIAYLEQQELLRTVSRTVFQSDYQYVAKNIFESVDAKYKQLNYSYDTDTQHMLNRTQQRSWDAYFKKQLEYLPIADNRSN